MPLFSAPKRLRFSFVLCPLSAALAWLVLNATLPANAAAATPAPTYQIFFGTDTGKTSQGIYAATFDSAGNLSTARLVATNLNPNFLALDSSGTHLYAAGETTNATGKHLGALFAYAISPAGELTLLGEQISHGEQFCHLQVSPDNGALLAASYDGGSVAAFPLATNGAIEPLASFMQHHGHSVYPANQSSPHAHCINLDPGGRLALVCDLGLDQIVEYQFDSATATLSPHEPASISVTPGNGPRHLAFHPSGKFLYVVNEIGCSVSSFRYESNTGNLTALQTNTLLPGNELPNRSLSGAEIAVSANGKFLYCSTRGPDQIVVFQINSKSGKLALVEMVASGGKTPRFFALDPSGRFLLAANQQSDNVVVFQINPGTGRLTPHGAPLTVVRPTCAVFAPIHPSK